MKQCYKTDLEEKEGEIKLQKINNVERIANKILNNKFQEKCIEKGALKEIKHWLEPLPDNSLPNIKIRKTFLELLYNMKYVTKGDLLNSQVGKIVNFYAKNHRENNEIRKYARNLIGKWKSMIIREEHMDYE
ncbi:hypothetical protein NUSPORA_03013 [Nucleospora cyclopteri]